MKCRHCKLNLNHVFLDLGHAPPSNSYLKKLKQEENFYPLKLYVCHCCGLVQTVDYAERNEFFNEDYAYFSSISESFLNHAKTYSEMIINRLDLNKDSFVVEIASNDGYLLKNFVGSKIPCLGIEPTKSTAQSARLLNIPVKEDFFDSNLASTIARSEKKADLILGNNVYAHVPDINDFTKGLKLLLNKKGTINLEFPHLMQLLMFNQFDTVYHEHYSYLSLRTVIKIFEKTGLDIYDVDELEIHGGSLRVYGCHKEENREISKNVKKVINLEKKLGMEKLKIYKDFQKKSEMIKDTLNSFLVKQKKENKLVCAYGAAAKGSTLLNYAGIDDNLIKYVFDAAPSKQNKFLPGSHIPILHPNEIKKIKPDVLIILPWNIKDEIITQNSYVKKWGCEFVTFIPKLEIIK